MGFSSVLIANRGEIAVRIIRACREEGLRSVAVCSEADKTAPHVLLADETVLLGPAQSSESYLVIEKLLGAARSTGAEAIHPGYGFLSESSAFARAVDDAGLAFVGPPVSAMEAMGDKPTARARMHAAGVPVISGSEPVASSEEALAAAGEIGFPVLLKAVAGGGGKGMHLARGAREVGPALKRARGEAATAFGDDRVYLEKFLEDPRHIEVQVLSDASRSVHLWERECSVQRRHQKLIEEAPAATIHPEVRTAMGEVAVRAAEAVGYRGAGTIEFLAEGCESSSGRFYFLEMNTRIQVEHTVTEMTTGVDLVREQLRIARGLPLLGGQEPPRPRGHAVECRISAEDPANGFLPSTGVVTAVEIPTGPGVRWDGGIRRGTEVGLHYDPLLGKLIVHGEDRAAALARMLRALEELRIEGVATTAPFHLAVLREPDFRANQISIRYLERHPDLVDPGRAALEEAALAAAGLLELDRRPCGGVATRGRRSDPTGSTDSGDPCGATSSTGSRRLSPWVMAGHQ